MYKLYKRMGESKFLALISSIAVLIQFPTVLTVLSLMPNDTGINISIAITVIFLALVPAVILLMEYKQLRGRRVNRGKESIK